MNAQRKHNLRNTAHRRATGISSSRAILSVVEVSEEEREVKKKLEWWPKFPNFDENYKPADRESQLTPRKRNMKKTVLGHIIVQLLKASQTKMTHYGLDSSFLTGKNASRGQWSHVLKNCQVRILYPAKRYFNHEGEIHFFGHKSQKNSSPAGLHDKTYPENFE